MRRFFRAVNHAPENLVFWFLDYVYVVWAYGAVLLKGFRHTSYQLAWESAAQVIVIPGVYEKWYIMKPVVEVLRRNGYAVHVIESLGLNAGRLEEMAERIDYYARQKNLTKYSIVAHSKGGLIAKYLLDTHPTMINRIVTINTPFNGSSYAKLLPLPALRMFIPNSRTLLALAQQNQANGSITSIYSKFDPHIPAGSNLVGAHNVRLNTHGHFRILKDRIVHEEIIKALRS